MKTKQQDKFHTLARDAGLQVNRYMLTYASGAIGVLFVSLINHDPTGYLFAHKILITAALILFGLTVATCLLELHIDARRFFLTAKQGEWQPEHQDWQIVNQLKFFRIKLRYLSYGFLLLGTLCAALFLIIRLFNH